MSVETRNGILIKLGLFGASAIGLFMMGKRHIASYKDERHKKETDARTDSQAQEFGVTARRPGFPTNNPTLDYEGKRESKYQGSGVAYSSRRPGDRLSMFAIFDRSWDQEEKDESHYYDPKREK